MIHLYTALQAAGEPAITLAYDFCPSVKHLPQALIDLGTELKERGEAAFKRQQDETAAKLKRAELRRAKAKGKGNGGLRSST